MAAAAAPMKAYTVFAHGCDNLSEGLKIVPPDCVYVTYELCGILSHGYTKMMYATMDPSIRAALNDPIGHEAELKAYFGKDLLHVHPPGSEYIDSTYTGVLNTSGDPSLEAIPRNSAYIYKSGLYPIEDFRPYDKAGDLIQQLYTVLDLDTPIDHDTWLSIYSGSIPETRIPFDQHYTMRHYTQNDIIWKISSAFIIYPGIYYNFVCRGDCNPIGPYNEADWIQRVARQRRVSHPEIALPPLYPNNIAHGATNEGITTISRYAHGNRFYHRKMEWFHEKRKSLIESGRINQLLESDIFYDYLAKSLAYDNFLQPFIRDGIIRPQPGVRYVEGDSKHMEYDTEEHVELMTLTNRDHVHNTEYLLREAFTALDAFNAHVAHERDVNPRGIGARQRENLLEVNLADIERPAAMAAPAVGGPAGQRGYVMPRRRFLPAGNARAAGNAPAAGNARAAANVAAAHERADAAGQNANAAQAAYFAARPDDNAAALAAAEVAAAPQVPRAAPYAWGFADVPQAPLRFVDIQRARNAEAAAAAAAARPGMGVGIAGLFDPRHNAARNRALGRPDLAAQLGLRRGGRKSRKHQRKHRKNKTRHLK